MRKSATGGKGLKRKIWQYNFEHLEDRTVPAIALHQEAWDLVPTYSPPANNLVNLNGYLTGPQAGDPADIAINYIRDHRAELGLSLADTQNYIVTDFYTDQDTVGTSHLYLAQSFNQLQVSNALMSVNVTRDGHVLTLGSNFSGGLSAWQTYPQTLPTPGLSAGRAIVAASAQLGIEVTSDPIVVTPASGLDQYQGLVSPQASQDGIPAKLTYIVAEDGAHLTWKLILNQPNGDHWYEAYADAETGQLRHVADYVDDISYQVYPIPVESPIHGGRSILGDPSNATASPFGWHDTNGAAGAEFTDTRGNNVSAQEDTDANNTGGTRPSGGASLDFQFALDLTQAPSTYQSASTTNLFYWNNIIHDVYQLYGFTPVAGNFQTNNYGGGGLGNDAVNADSQDGSGTNNANFSTPADGSAPRMQQFIFTTTSPNRDSDLDSGVIIHEYTHGLSNRLTGGPANSNALNALQSGGMGEGWGDFMAMMLTQLPTDNINDAYPMGTYVLGQPTNGAGIRRQPYSFNMAVNTQTIGLFNSSTEVHDAGELWCDALWDLNWLLINKFGYDANLYTGYVSGGGPASAGNKLAMRLVLDAMKLQPANPSFLDARNAIFAADQALTGGANKAEIWQAFARRGMGVSFVDTSASASSVTQAFDVPAPFTLPLTADAQLGSLVYEGSVTGIILTAAAVDSYTMSLDAGQKATLIVTPTGSTLRPTVELRDPSNAVIGTSTAAAAGSKAFVQSVSLTAAGTYTINVLGNSSTTGGYTARLVLNSAVEAETLGTGATNNTTGTAQNIDSAFGTITGAAQAAAVFGTSDLGGTLSSEAEANGTTGTANSLNNNFNAVSNNLYHIGVSGNISSGTDVDWFNIGLLQVGDIITISESGTGSSRGTLSDPFVDLFRSGNLATATASDDDNGPSTDSLIYRFTITVADNYFVRANDFSTEVGTYQLGIFLENSGAAPTTGGSLTAETEANDTSGTANDATNAWRAVQYVSRTNGTITTGDLDFYSATFTAGDLVTINAKSLSGLDARVSLLNSGGTAIATENGTSGTGADSPIYSFVIPSTGTYFVEVFAASGTGAYYVDVDLSTGTAPTTPPPVSDLYSFTLNAGQAVSMSIKGSGLTLDLLNSGGTSIATAVAGATNVDLALNNFVAPSAGTYFAKVGGSGLVNYNLLVTRGTSIETEANDTFATGQNISGAAAVLGHTANDDFYRVSLTAGQTITLQTFTPGDGAGQFVNVLNPALDIFDPSGVLLSSDDNSAPDGRNALLVRNATVSGLYGVRVRGVSATTGEYLMTVGIAAGGDVTAPTITGLFVDGTTWTTAFRTAAGNANYGYPAQTGAAQLTSLPWSTINTFYVKFSEDVSVQTGDLGVRGLNVLTYTPTLASYDNVNFVAKFTLPAPVDTDRLILDLDGVSATAVVDLAGNKLAGSWTEGVSTFPTAGAAANSFKYRVVVAVGDADRNAQVRNVDVNAIRANLFVDAGAGGYSIFADIDGNGQTRNADVNAARAHLFVDPPAGPGPNRPIRGGSSGGRGAGSSTGGRFVANNGTETLRTGGVQRRLATAPRVVALDDLFAEI